MSIACNTAFKNWVAGGDGYRAVTFDTYSCTNSIPPNPLNIQIEQFSPNEAMVFTFTGTGLSKRFVFSIMYPFLGQTINRTVIGYPTPGNVAITANYTNVEIVLRGTSINGLIAGTDYIVNDTYTIFVSQTGAYVQARLDIGGKIRTIPTNGNSLLQVPIPTLLINGQTLADASDMGDVVFIIKDDRFYYQEKPLHSKCGEYNIDKIKTTMLERCCPKLVTVFRGKGTTLLEKAIDIYSNNNIQIPFRGAEGWYLRIFLYAMTKYILARILYGNFDVDYLLQKHNKQFLKDLSKSRFCQTLPFFTDPDSVVYGFNQYFK